MGRRRQNAVVNGNALSCEVSSSSYPLPIFNVFPASPIRPRIENESVRRSERVKNLALPAPTPQMVIPAAPTTKMIMPAVQYVNLTDKGKRPMETDHFSRRPNVVKESSLDEKVNYLVRMVNEFKPKIFGKNNRKASQDITYKRLYMQAQDKYDALMVDHFEAVSRLEFTRGQIAAYEKMHGVGGVRKEVIFVAGAGADEAAQPSTSFADFAPNAAAVAEVENPKKKRAYNKKKRAV